jgi:hypothetical protein
VFLDLDGDSDMNSLSTSPIGASLTMSSVALSVFGECNNATAMLPRFFASIANTTRDMCAADFDGDGTPEIVIASDAGGVRVLSRGTLAGAMLDATTAVMPVGTVSGVAVGAADFDGDGDVDLVVGGSTGVLLLNNGSGVLTVVRLTTSLDGVSWLVPFDCDTDGDVDVFAAAPGGAAARLLLNDGAGNFVDNAARAGVVAPSGPALIRRVAVADIDGDGDVDVLVTGSAANQLFVNNGSCGFSEQASSRGVASPASAGSFGDVDNDGDVDVWLDAALRVNNGSGVFVSAVGPTVPASLRAVPPVLADIDADGDLDVPAFGVLGAVSTPSSRAVVVRLVGRNGRLNQLGAVVCLSYVSNSSRVGCRTVGGGGASGTYDVHFGVWNVTAPLSADVTFVGGRRHNASTQAWLAYLEPWRFRVSVIRDMPSIALLWWSRTGAVLGVNSSISLFVQARWGDEGLRPASATVNGAVVSASFVSVGGGVYRFTYSPSSTATNVLFGGIRVSVALAAFDFVSNVATEALLVNNSVAVDTRAPQLTRVRECGPVNGTVSTRTSERLCAVVLDEVLACTLWYSINGSLPRAADGNGSLNAWNFTVGEFLDGAAVTVRLWATDAAGNNGSVLAVSWIVDLNSPVTQWPSALPDVTRESSLSLGLSCSRSDCRYLYSLDSGAFSLLGAALNSTNATIVNATAASAVPGNAVVNVTAPRALQADPLRLQLRVVRNGSAEVLLPSPSPSTASVQLRLDGGTDSSMVANTV